jgi:hypothetical protein
MMGRRFEEEIMLVLVIKGLASLKGAAARTPLLALDTSTAV